MHYNGNNLFLCLILIFFKMTVNEASHCNLYFENKSKQHIISKRLWGKKPNPQLLYPCSDLWWHLLCTLELHRPGKASRQEGQFFLWSENFLHRAYSAAGIGHWSSDMGLTLHLHRASPQRGPSTAQEGPSALPFQLGWHVDRKDSEEEAGEADAA